MKRALAFALILMAVFQALPAVGARIPSRTTQDMAEVVSFVSDSGAAAGEDFVIALTEKVEKPDLALAQIARYIEENGSALIRYFSEEIQEKAVSLLPESVRPDDLDMNEFSPMVVLNYETSYAGVTARFRFATRYEEGQALVALVGIITGTDADGNPTIDWSALKAEAKDGDVVVHFTQELLPLLDGRELVIAVLSANLPG